MIFDEIAVHLFGRLLLAKLYVTLCDEVLLFRDGIGSRIGFDGSSKLCNRILQIDAAWISNAAFVVELIEDGILGFGATDTGHGARLLRFVGLLLRHILKLFPPLHERA